MGGDLEVLVHQLAARVEQLEAELDGHDHAPPVIIRTAEHLDTSWILITSSLVFLMQLGFAMLESGMCRQNNVIATYVKNLLDFVFGAIVAFAFGYTIAYGVTPWLVPHDDYKTFNAFFHHLVFQATAATIVSGAVAERTKISGYIILSSFISGGPFSLVVRWSWGGGWLAQLEPAFHDFAGSAVVHAVGGWSAFVAVAVLGARNGRYDQTRFYDFMPCDVGGVLGGALILWVGWYGFNTSSTNTLLSDADNLAAANAAMTTTLGAASACIASLVFMVIRAYMVGGTPAIDAIGTANGVLAGLVSITAGADCINGPNTILVGTGGALVYLLASAASEHLHLDDVCEAWAVHGCCGIWGTIAVGLFHKELGLFYTGSFSLIWSQTIGSFAIILVTLVSCFIVCQLLKYFDIFRVAPEEEARGLDHKFGAAASSYMLQKNQRLRATFITLQAYGCTIDQLTQTLDGLKDRIFLPFTPQGGDLVIDGQVAQILSRLDWNMETLSKFEYVAFLSHHKADAGDAARIFVDTARRLIDKRRSVSDAASKLLAPVRDRETAGRNWWDEGGQLHIPSEKLIFLDSNNLSDLKELLKQVDKSANHLLMMSRQVLERPWVLCELVAAAKTGKPFHVIAVGKRLTHINRCRSRPNRSRCPTLHLRMVCKMSECIRDTLRMLVACFPFTQGGQGRPRKSSTFRGILTKL